MKKLHRKHDDRVAATLKQNDTADLNDRCICFTKKRSQVAKV